MCSANRLTKYYSIATATERFNQIHIQKYRGWLGGTSGTAVKPLRNTLNINTVINY